MATIAGVPGVGDAVGGRAGLAGTCVGVGRASVVGVRLAGADAAAGVVVLPGAVSWRMAVGPTSVPPL
jgi:hypothetical protein